MVYFRINGRLSLSMINRDGMPTEKPFYQPFDAPNRASPPQTRPRQREEIRSPPLHAVNIGST